MQRFRAHTGIFRSLTGLINLKGELFASTFTYGLSALIRLGSSLVLTRLLNPESYGIFGILFSILFMIELMSDVGSVGLLVRHPRGNELRFIHTVWTVRLIRSIINFCLLFFGAPVIAHIFNAPVLTGAFRALSFWFLLFGAESMSFVLAQRDQKARITNYVDLASNAIMTVFVIALASVLKNHFALIFGALLQRAILMITSFFFYREIGVGIAFDREALRDQFKFARVVLPSSLLTIVLSQYDKLVLLKLFNLSLLGIYGLAGNMIGPIGGVIIHNARVILYARCAEYFRSDRTTARTRYYAENHKLLTVGVILPAVVAGLAQLIVAILYDPRYEMAGTMLMILGLGGIIIAVQNASENLLVASGRTHMVLVANIIRLCSVIPATFLGYYLFGFYGFLWFNFAATIPLLLYFYSEQRRLELLNLTEELKRLGAALAVFLLCLAVSHLLMAFVPENWLHLGLKKH
jgi:O-antigen/teichoic acid export membrane protein